MNRDDYLGNNDVLNHYLRPGTNRDFIGYGQNVPKVIWPNQARLALSLIVNYEEGSEYNILDGDARNDAYGEIHYSMSNEYRDLSNESVYEYGSRVGIWRLFRLFQQFGINVTVFAAALALKRNPAVGKAIRSEGHEVCGHGWRWVDAWPLSKEQERESITRAIDDIRAVCGERPYGWYTRYGPSVYTRELLVEEGGFVYDSDAYNDDLPYFVEVNGTRHLVVPYTHSYNDGRFAILPGYSSPWDFFENARRAIQYLWEEGEDHPKMLSIGLHPRWVGQAGRTSAVRDIIEYALDLGDIWFARRIDIAQWWLDKYESFIK